MYCKCELGEINRGMVARHLLDIHMNCNVFRVVRRNTYRATAWMPFLIPNVDVISFVVCYSMNAVVCLPSVRHSDSQCRLCILRAMASMWMVTLSSLLSLLSPLTVFYYLLFLLLLFAQSVGATIRDSHTWMRWSSFVCCYSRLTIRTLSLPKSDTNCAHAMTTMLASDGRGRLTFAVPLRLFIITLTTT